jgi:hypothetical protein
VIAPVEVRLADVDLDASRVNRQLLTASNFLTLAFYPGTHQIFDAKLNVRLQLFLELLIQFRSIRPNLRECLAD